MSDTNGDAIVDVEITSKMGTELARYFRREERKRIIALLREQAAERCPECNGNDSECLYNAGAREAIGAIADDLELEAES